MIDRVRFASVSEPRLRHFSIGLAALILLPAPGHAKWESTTDSAIGGISALFDAGPYLLAATEGSAYRSDGDGSGWIRFQAGLYFDYIESFAQSGGLLFAGTQGHGMFRSADSGSHWTEVNTGMARIQINTVAVLGSQVFAGSYRGVFRSKDGGASWEELYKPGSNGLSDEITGLAASGTAMLAATRHSGLFRSVDSGGSWDLVRAGTYSTLAGDGGTLLAGTWDGGIVLSLDGGKGWKGLDKAFPSAVTALTVKGANLFAGSGAALIHIAVDGSTSSQVEAGWPNYGIVNALVVRGDYLFAGISGGGSAPGVCNGVWKRPLIEAGSTVRIPGPSHALNKGGRMGKNRYDARGREAWTRKTKSTTSHGDQAEASADICVF